MQTTIIGRSKERQKFDSLKKSKKSEFVVVYGRRRVGKTFLIREHFEHDFEFYLTGLANATTKQQLFSFDMALQKQSTLFFDNPSINWLDSFNRLRMHIESIPTEGKKIIFIDELPWLDTHGSDFIIGLEHFWNSWASSQKNIILIVCGSAASWMINNLINNTGGLYNRVTQKIKLNPFTLHETELYFRAKNSVLDHYQIAQIYMAIGGIPFYLDLVQVNKSAAQNIQDLFFEKTSPLVNEYYNLYRSLYKNYELYEMIIEVLFSKRTGLTRKEIIEKSKLSSGGTLSRVLNDLEESGFIRSYPSLDQKQKNYVYRIADFYTNFFLYHIKGQKSKPSQNWINSIDSPSIRAWQGLAFEHICLDHSAQIKYALGISGVSTAQSVWTGRIDDKAAQVDLVIDRRDSVINLCECKFSMNEYEINAGYAKNIQNKISTFKEVTKTRKSVFFTMITTFGVKENQHCISWVQNTIQLSDLFVKFL